MPTTLAARPWLPEPVAARLGGRPGGLLVTNDAELAERLEAIAYPGVTANFETEKTAALAQTMLDWTVAGPTYAAAMGDTACALARGLAETDNPVVKPRGA